MELQTQPSNPSSPSIYLTAPSSPNGFFRSRSLEYYYSATPSPRRTDEKQQKSDFPDSVFDDFEFETSKKFNYSPIVVVDDDDDGDPRCRERGDSFPAMAFADELFVNGLVMPLKLPPRLQNDSDLSFSQKSPVSSPKSPRTVLKNLFARKNAWNDDFDPFMVALQKVREEKRNSYHRRSMSQNLPFKILSKSYSDIYSFDNQDNNKGNSLVKLTGVLKPSFSGPLDFKGSAYARWAREQIKEGALIPPKSSRGFLFGHGVRLIKVEHDCLEESVGAKNVEEKRGKVEEESKAQKMKGVLLKYASFGRENSGGKQIKITSGERKTGYFSRLSFKFGNGSESVKKSIAADEKMDVVEYKAKQSLGLCLGYGVASPGKMK